MTALLLKHCRKESGLKQADFIKKHKIPVTQATFSRWEKGKHAVPVAVSYTHLTLPTSSGVEV